MADRRLTCRNEDGTARLAKGVNLMDAIERLCRIEERAFGVLVVGQDENQARAAEGANKRWGKVE